VKWCCIATEPATRSVLQNSEGWKQPCSKRIWTMIRHAAPNHDVLDHRTRTIPLDEPRVLCQRIQISLNRSATASCMHASGQDWGARHFETEGAGMQQGSKERMNVFSFHWHGYALLTDCSSCCQKSKQD
jgi:hypothetical protein